MKKYIRIHDCQECPGKVVYEQIGFIPTTYSCIKNTALDVTMNVKHNTISDDCPFMKK